MNCKTPAELFVTRPREKKYYFEKTENKTHSS